MGGGDVAAACAGLAPIPGRVMKDGILIVLSFTLARLKRDGGDSGKP